MKKRGATMGIKTHLTRREILKASVAGLSFMYLPGIGRVKAMPFTMTRSGDYFGRLCYNENPLGPSPLALEAMQRAVTEANRYPDWFNSNLESQIALHHGLPANTICAGTGATEVIRLVADAYLSEGDEMITATPTYYQMAYEAIANGASVVHVPLDEHYVIDLNGIKQAITPSTRLISLVNPNNPLGTCIHKADMEAFIDSLPGGIVVVVDEAYHHYIHSPDYESCIRFVKEGLPVIVIWTYSKIYGLAGARIGYSVAPSQYTAQIASSQNFGMVSNMSQAAALAALEDAQHVTDTITLNDQAKEILQNGFTNLGLDYIPSETNFMMFDTGTSASWVASELSTRGFQVRTGWGMPQHIRISTGTLEEMHHFISALGDILSQKYEGGDRPVFGLNAVYPSPFQSQCTVKITTSGDEKVFLAIYDSSGRKVQTLLNQPLAPGVHSIDWDGKDVLGKRVASGVYIMNLRQGEFASSRKVTLIR
jgi:histidinol-phosphate aminotransferase